MIYDDFIMRYNGNVLAGTERCIYKQFPIPILRKKFEKLMNDRRLKKIKVFSGEVFWPQIRNKHIHLDFPF